MNVVARLAALLGKKPEPLKTPLTYPSEWLLDREEVREQAYRKSSVSAMKWGYLSTNELRAAQGLRPLTEKANTYLSLHERTASAGCKGCGASQWKGSTCAYCGRQS